MIFSYLNLPAFPNDLIPGCLKNIDLIDTDPILYQTVNKNRGPANYGTWVSLEANQWLHNNIIIPYFSPIRPEMQNNLMGVTFYAKNKEKPQHNGQQGPHRDIGRHWAINYIFDTGGDNVTTRWYDDDKNLTGEVTIQPYRWCLLKVDGLHAVRNIKLGRLRTFISIDVKIKDEEEFNASNYFGHVIDSSTIIREYA